MVCIIQTKHTSRLPELFICQALEGCLCSDRHKDRQRDGAMREVEGACAGLGCLIRDMRQISSQKRMSSSVLGYGKSYRTFGMPLKGQCGRHGFARGFGRCRHGADWSVPCAVCFPTIESCEETLALHEERGAWEADAM